MRPPHDPDGEGGLLTKPERATLLSSAAFALISTAGLCTESRADDLPARLGNYRPIMAPAPVVSGTWSRFNVPAPSYLPPPSSQKPSTRLDHTTIYDPVGDRTIMFGGEQSGILNNETWSLSAYGEWTQLAPAGTIPATRRDHSAIYDPGRRRMVVFGGATPINHNDTYVLSLTGTPTWTQMLPAGTPPPVRLGHTAIYDPLRDRMIVFGGYNAGVFLNDVYELTFTGTPTWSRIFPTGTAPARRNAMTAIYDPVGDRMLIFGGYDGMSFRNDLWAFSFSGTPEWTQVSASGIVPSARRVYAAVCDALRERLLIFGGEGVAGYRNDTYALALAGAPNWTTIAA